MTPQNVGTTGLVEQVRRVNQAPNPDQRRIALDILARTVLESGTVRGVVSRLLTADLSARRIALELVLRFPIPLDEGVIKLLEPVLADHEIPSALRTAIAPPMIKSLPTNDQQIVLILRSLISNTSRSKALDRLRQVRQRIRECAALDALMEQLESKLQMKCPRCATRLPRPEMVKHLWQEHRLMLDGQKVREPWRMIEDWLGDYQRTGDANVLERCCELGEQLDPDGGLVRVHRLLLGAGHADAEALQNLRSEAAHRHATLCPHCFALVALPDEKPIPPLTVSHGRVASRGYTVDVDDRGAISYLTISTPTGVVFDGIDPIRNLTRTGRIVMMVGPFILLALVLAFWLPRDTIPPFLPVASVLIVAVGFFVSALFRVKRNVPQTTRAIDAAWTQLVPQLHSNGFSGDDAAFIRTLARVSVSEGQPKMRELSLAEISKRTQSELTSRTASLDDLVELRRLEIADAARSDRDPMLVLAAEVGACLKGELALEYAERLLGGWETVEWWTRGNRARLMVMLAATAFDAGWEVWDLHELGENVPNLGAALGSEDFDHLACLKRLWLLKAERSWQETGHATPVFDLARFPSLGGQYLEARPDLLLFQPMTDGDGENASSDPILICEEGVVYRGHLISDPNAEVKIKAIPLWQRGGFELVCGNLRLQFRQEPVFLAKRLQGWIHFLFKVFLPTVDGMLKSRSRELLARMLRQKTITCHECHEPFLIRRGERGEPLEGPKSGE